MHIPDGFLSPQTWLPASVVAFVAVGIAVRNLRTQLNEHNVPRIAMLTSLAYALGLVMIPLPGGSSTHLIGVAAMALIFGVRLAFLAYSLVLLLQSLLFGAGGMTSLAVNSLIMGGLGSLVAVGLYRLCIKLGEGLAVSFAAWGSVLFSGFCIALILGIQPILAHSPDGTPLFFPFDYRVTLPAILLPHLLLGGVEAAFTLFIWRYAKSRHWQTDERGYYAK